VHTLYRPKITSSYLYPYFIVEIANRSFCILSLKRLKSNGKRFVRVGSDFVVVNTSLLEAERRKLNIEQILCLQAFHLADNQILDRKGVPKSSLAS
jgi:hypothetical protein